MARHFHLGHAKIVYNSTQHFFLGIFLEIALLAAIEKDFLLHSRTITIFESPLHEKLFFPTLFLGSLILPPPSLAPERPWDRGCVFAFVLDSDLTTTTSSAILKQGNFTFLPYSVEICHKNMSISLDFGYDCCRI